MRKNIEKERKIKKGNKYIFKEFFKQILNTKQSFQGSGDIKGVGYFVR